MLYTAVVKRHFFQTPKSDECVCALQFYKQSTSFVFVLKKKGFALFSPNTTVLKDPCSAQFVQGDHAAHRPNWTGWFVQLYLSHCSNSKKETAVCSQVILDNEVLGIRFTHPG